MFIYLSRCILSDTYIYYLFYFFIYFPLFVQRMMFSYDEDDKKHNEFDSNKARKVDMK
jgi:hypothetical protein